MDKKINEEVQEEAYKIADHILNAIKGRDTITKDEFEEQIALACRELYGIDNVWETMDHEKGLATINGKQFDMNDLDADIRGILSYNGWATDFKDGDLTTKEVENESLKETYTYSTAREHWGHQALDLVNEWLEDHAQAKADIIAYIKNKNIKNEGQLEGILSCFNFDGDTMPQLKDESLKEDAKEPKLETFEEKIDFLVKDEDEAIDGYDKIIAMLGDDDANAIEQLNHIKEEEVAHKDFLEVLKKDPSAIYNHEDEEEPIENDDDKIEVSNDEFIDDIALDDIDDAFGEGLDEDTIKKGNKWVNKGADGEHGEFKTKKEADAQRKAMFANGYHEDFDDDFGFNHVIDDDDDFEKLGTVNWDDLDDEDAEIIRKGNEAHKKLMGVKEIRDAVVDDTLDDFPERKRDVIKKALDMKFEKPIEEDSHNTGHIKAKKPIELKARVEK